MAPLPRYARGSRAWGECARSGQRMLLKDMVEDPLTGLMVAPDWCEPPLMRPATDIFDGVQLERPAPDLDQVDVTIYLGQIVDPASGEPTRPLCALFEMGIPIVQVG